MAPGVWFGLCSVDVSGSGTLTAVPQDQRGFALELASQLLDDIELSRIPPTQVIRKASRLARLIDDAGAMRWLWYEINGYPTLDEQAVRAALRSSRLVTSGPTKGNYWTGTVGFFEAQEAAAIAELGATSGVASGEWAAVVNNQNVQRRVALSEQARTARDVIDKVIGAVHGYVSDQYHALRFGSAVATAFDAVRADVDASIASLVPEAAQMLAAAFENAASQNPEHWAGAAATCRRLLKATADTLRPPGPPVAGHPMTDANYINRLVEWISSRGPGGTERRVIEAELAYMGRRLDAADQAGQKGAHSQVTRAEASRYLVGTYLVLGDVLALSQTGESQEPRAVEALAEHGLEE